MTGARSSVGLEHLITDQGVGGSSPPGRAIRFDSNRLPPTLVPAMSQILYHGHEGACHTLAAFLRLVCSGSPTGKVFQMAMTATALSDHGAKGYFVAKKATPSYVKGRRDFFKYRDLGVTAASGGIMRAQVTEGSAGMTRPTGWHYHVCDGQFVYMLSGWVDLAFPNGETVRIEEGDSLFIPGGLPHNEIATSDTLELIEVSVPADMGTESCDPPDGGPENG